MRESADRVIRTTSRRGHAEWLGSTAWDGFPGTVFEDGAPPVDELGWREWVAARFANRDDATLPSDGWPWPWEDSNTTDYSYACDEGAIWGTCFGYGWFKVDASAEGCGEPDEHGEDKTCVFPNMKARQSVATGSKRSGVFIISAGPEGLSVS